MGIYIPGIEMPKDGCHHIICIYADGTVSTGGQVYKAVPVPPHGRLGDLDELHKEAVRRSEKAGTYGSWYNCTDRVISAFDIKNAPTVIQASEEEKA